MCQQGINLDQLRLSVGQAGDVIGTAQSSLEQLHHLADNGSQPEASARIAQASVLLGEARAKLEEAVDQLDGDSGGVSVELV